MHIVDIWRRITLVLLLVLSLTLPVYATQTVEVESLRKGVVTTNVVVGTVATALPPTALKGRKTILITNNSSNTIYIGDSSVTASNGTPLVQSQTAAADITDSIVIYGIATTAGNDVRILELK